MPNVACAQNQTIFYNGNVNAVRNSPTRPTVFTLSVETEIAKITTYHWNNGRGAAPGTISIMSNNTGELYGPWQAVADAGQGGVPNAYWVVTPNVTLSAGDYIVLDSDKATWAQNPASGGSGFVWVDASVGGK